GGCHAARLLVFRRRLDRELGRTRMPATRGPSGSGGTADGRRFLWGDYLWGGCLSSGCLSSGCLSGGCLRSVRRPACFDQLLKSLVVHMHAKMWALPSPWLQLTRIEGPASKMHQCVCPARGR